MKVFILTLLLLMGHCVVSMDAGAFKNEPEGFMNMHWGAPADALFSRDDYVGYSSDEKSHKYQKINETDSLDVDNSKPYGMVYSFYNGMLWKVEIEARLFQAGKLLPALVGKYGNPARDILTSEFNRQYSWLGVVTDIDLLTSLNFYDRKTVDIATVFICSKKLKSAIDADVDPYMPELQLPVDLVDGFRGRKWGSGFDAPVIYQPLSQEPFFEYQIKDDQLEFEGVVAREIRYRFYNNKALQKVELGFSGKQNYIKLKQVCFRLFGNISRYEQGTIKWIGKTSTVCLSFVIDAKGEWQSRLMYFGFGSQ